MLTINRLGEVFAEKKIYNRNVAEYLDKSEGTVSRWVNNHRQPTLEQLNKIAEYLRIDIRSLLNPSDWSNSKVKAFEKKKGEV